MTQHMWATAALASEITLSVAYGGVPTVYDAFTHIYNQAVPWAGDFNRAVNIKSTDCAAFMTVATRVEQLHWALQIDPPTRFDLQPAASTDQSWVGQLTAHNYRVETALFFQAPTQQTAVSSPFALYIPNLPEYIAWYQQRQQAQPFYTPAYFQQLWPLQLRFIQAFQPYWLMYNDALVGWVYCAILGDYCRLFEVEVGEAWRGKGAGTAFLQLLKSHFQQQGIAHILLQSGERLRPFYERAGFQVCTSNSIIWRV